MNSTAEKLTARIAAFNEIDHLRTMAVLTKVDDAKKAGDLTKVKKFAVDTYSCDISTDIDVLCHTCNQKQPKAD